jgi:hypothetical protein
LLGGSLFVAPLYDLYILARFYAVFHPDTLAAYFSGAIANPNGWMTLVLGKVGFHLLSAAFLALLIVLFFKRRQIFPTVFIWTAVGRLVLFAADIFASRLVLGSGKYTYDYIAMVSVLIYMVFWCAYLARSKHVQTVFVVRAQNRGMCRNV